MNYEQADAQLTGRNRESRKLANNTYLIRDGANIAVCLHTTNVLTFTPDGDTILQTGGWQTVTTKDRINGYLEGFCIEQDHGVWYLHRLADGYSKLYRRVFREQATIRKDGTVEGLQADNPKADRQIKRRVKAYAELCADAIPLDMPDNGDCWDCLMRTEEGKSLGDVSHSDHLESHMEEGYVVPSLPSNERTQGTL